MVMFSSITWQQYFIAMAIAVGLYYAIIWLLFFQSLKRSKERD
jgi:hypothetical protein